MYDSLASFLRSFSADFPILWALLVMAVIAGAGFALYAFWELALRWLSSAFHPRSHDSEGPRA
jgi:predicted permease